VHPGDLVILISYGVMDEAAATSYVPKVVHVDAGNRVVELGGDPSAPVPGNTDHQRSPLAVSSAAAGSRPRPGFPRERASGGQDEVLPQQRSGVPVR
jgi:aspartate 1-decarboxylase